VKRVLLAAVERLAAAFIRALDALGQPRDERGE
jgi:hypothetical protein